MSHPPTRLPLLLGFVVLAMEATAQGQLVPSLAGKPSTGPCRLVATALTSSPDPNARSVCIQETRNNGAVGRGFYAFLLGPGETAHFVTAIDSGIDHRISMTAAMKAVRSYTSDQKEANGKWEKIFKKVDKNWVYQNTTNRVQEFEIRGSFFQERVCRSAKWTSDVPTVYLAPNGYLQVTFDGYRQICKGESKRGNFRGEATVRFAVYRNSTPADTRTEVKWTNRKPSPAPP